jgi:hypothetical protein
LLHPDSRYRGLRQPLSNFTASKADVLQFSIAKLAKNRDICLARPVRERRGNHVIYKATETGDKMPDLSPNFERGHHGASGDINYRHRNFPLIGNLSFELT